MKEHQTEDAIVSPSEPQFSLTGQSFQSEIAALQDFLLSNLQSSVSISAKALTRSDSRLLQYLIAATANWRERGLALEVADLPSAFEAHFANLGISAEMIIRKSV
jgi:anti-anti-sigma regulatory factor